MKQGESTVGNMLERMDSTNIGLAKLNYGVSSKRFLYVHTAAKGSCPVIQVEPMDRFYIFVIGRQFVSCRVGKTRGQAQMDYRLMHHERFN